LVTFSRNGESSDEPQPGRCTKRRINFEPEVELKVIKISASPVRLAPAFLSLSSPDRLKTYRDEIIGQDAKGRGVKDERRDW
jgi:hypothetical protein